MGLQLAVGAKIETCITPKYFTRRAGVRMVTERLSASRQPLYVPYVASTRVFCREEPKVYEIGCKIVHILNDFIKARGKCPCSEVGQVFRRVQACTLDLSCDFRIRISAIHGEAKVS